MALPLRFLFALVGYPFVYGIWLSLENRPVAQPGTFVGLAQLHRRCPRSRLLAGGAQYRSSTPAPRRVLKMVGGLGARPGHQPELPASRTSSVPRCCCRSSCRRSLSTVAWMWMLDPAFSVVNWVHRACRHRQSRSVLARQPDAGDGLDHRDQHLARPAVLRASRCWRDCRPSRPISMRPRRSTARACWTRFRYVTLPLLKPVDPDRDHVLAHLHLRRLPAGLCADPRRPGQRHAICSPPTRSISP